MKLISEKTTVGTSSISKCSPFSDSKFVCSTGSHLQMFDAKHMNRNHLKIVACSSPKVKIDKVFASKSLQRENMVAYTCNDEKLVVRYINFTSPNPFIQ